MIRSQQSKATNLIYIKDRKHFLHLLDLFIQRYSQRSCKLKIFAFESTPRYIKMDLAWTKSKEEILKYFEVDEDKGLSDSQVKRYQEKYGPNGKPCF